MLPVEIEFADRASDIDGRVWSASFPRPLEGRFWYQTLEESLLEVQFAFRYALIRSAGEPLGIAPCFLHDVPISLVAPAPVARVLRGLSVIFPRVARQRTLFIGSPCSDEGTVGLAHGVALADVMAGLGAALREEARRLRAPMIVFKDFPAADLPALTGGRRSDAFFPTASYPGTLVSLPGPDKEAYYRSLTHNQRHNLLKKLRRSRQCQAVGTSVVKSPSDRELSEILGLFKQTYEKGRTKFEQLDLRFFESIRAKDEASFILQRDPSDGALIAFMLVFRLGKRVINKFIGLDYGRPSGCYPYFRLFDAALDFAYGCGACELQSGQTGYRAKLDLGHRLVPLFNAFRHKNPLIHSVFRAIGSRVTWKSLDGDLAVYLRAHPELGK
jgi:hypothetical protein